MNKENKEINIYTHCATCNTKLTDSYYTLTEENLNGIVFFELDGSDNAFCSHKCACEMIGIKKVNEGWRYRVATPYNIPWVFGYVEGAMPMFGRLIIQGGQLHEALEKNCPKIKFVGATDDK